MSSSLSAGAAITGSRLRASRDQAGSAACRTAIGEQQGRLDAFLVSASSHVMAVEGVLVNAAREHLGRNRSADLDRTCHGLQLALRSMHARLYGSSQLMRVPWRAIWEDVDRHLEELLLVERTLSRDLDSVLAAREAERLILRLQAAELRGPTRPHPHLPRHGFRGRLARRMASWTDAFWDGVQGRVIALPALASSDSAAVRSAR